MSSMSIRILSFEENGAEILDPGDEEGLFFPITLTIADQVGAALRRHSIARQRRPNEPDTRGRTSRISGRNVYAFALRLMRHEKNQFLGRFPSI